MKVSKIVFEISQSNSQNFQKYFWKYVSKISYEFLEILKIFHFSRN